MFKKITSEISKNKKSIIWLLIFLVLFYFILPDKQTIENTINEIQGASLQWIILGSIIYYLTIPVYAFQILVLSKIKLKAWVTYKVQMSVLFTNKFLPSSISSFAMNSFYLSRVGHKPSEVASIIAMQGITSCVPFIFLTGVAIFIGISQFQLADSLNMDLGSVNWFKIIVLLLIAVFTIAFVIHTSTRLRKFLNKTIGSFWQQTKLYRKKPMSLVWAFLTGFTSPFFGVMALYASGHSVGLDVTIVQSFLIYALSTTLANLIPIPGGIGAAEAGLYAGFTFFGYPAAESMAATLIYRIITFWIPTIPGLIFFVDLRKDVLKGFSISGEFSKIKRHKKA